MGMSDFYGAARRRRVDHHDPPRARPRRHLPRHLRHVRTVHQRAARRPGDQGPARRSDRRDEVRHPAFPDRSRRSARCAATPRTCAQACDASLERLGIDTIDLYYVHRTDPNTPDRGDGRRDGRARDRGQGPLPRAVRGRAPTRCAARAPCTRSRRCRASGRCGAATSRPRWSASPRARRRHRPVQPARPRLPHRSDHVARRLRAPTTSARYSPRFMGDNFAKNLDLVDEVRKLAAEKGCTPGQLALAWVLAQGDDVAPIPGTKRVQVPRRERRRARRHADRRRPRRDRRRRSRIDAAAGDRYADMSPIEPLTPTADLPPKERSHENRTARRQLLVARTRRRRSRRRSRGIASAAEEAGHQPPQRHGPLVPDGARWRPPTEPMLEGYTTPRLPGRAHARP